MGTVTFFDGTTMLGTGTNTVVGGNLVASYTTTANQLAVGPHSLIAKYSDTVDSNFAASSSSATPPTFTVTGANTTTTLTSPTLPSSAAFGTPVA